MKHTAGTASITIIWTPTESPVIKKIRIIHLWLSLSWYSFSHFVISQTTNAMNIDAIEYTSPSTAEYQKVSEKVNASEPITPENSTEIISAGLSSSISLFKILRTKCVMVQKRNKIVNALNSADIALIISE